jgi:hypothetical protein
MKQQIQSVINNFTTGDLTSCALQLFETPGYKTSRRSPFPQKPQNILLKILRQELIFRVTKRLLRIGKVLIFCFN